MAKTKISEYSATSANNTDISNINIAEGCSPANVNNAIRTIMAQLKDQQDGTSGDPFTVGGNLTVTGTSTLTGNVTAPTQTSSDNSTKVATTAFVTTKIGALGTMASQNATAVAITGGTITGITDLTVADGGTGASSITANSVILGNGTSALSGNLVAPSTSGNVLTSNGTTWTSATPAGGLGVGQTWQDVLSSRNDTVVTAGSFVIGNIYTIVAVGTTNFTLIGASANTVGVVFTATGAGSGTGTARNTYKNTTGKPIVVNVVSDQGSSFSATLTATISGVEFTIATESNSSGGTRSAGNVIVPDNATYMIVASGSGVSGFQSWHELR
jgi:hypothetical protein